MHPAKRMRPLAAGTVSIRQAFIMLAVLFVLGTGGAWLLSPAFGAVATSYFLINLAYSFWLKNVSILDVIVIALGFVLRVEAGATLIHVAPSVWIIVCTGLLALFLAVAKRRDDLVQALGQDHRKSLDGYSKPFLDATLTMVLGALLVSYAIYTTDEQVIARMGTDRLYLTVPFVLAGIMRYLQITLVEERSGSPTRIVLTDRFMMAVILGWMATLAVLLYLH
jgi:4-hydroxybenzoate polyprenyltransferase